MKLSEASVVLFGEDIRSMDPERRLAAELLLGGLKDSVSSRADVRGSFRGWMELDEGMVFGARWLCERLGLPFCRYEKFLEENEFSGKIIRRKSL